MNNTTDPWEDAYLRFESPAREVRKFHRRLLRLGAASWNRDERIVELCCGRGGGLTALASLGFRNVEGIDLSPSLAASGGLSRITVADCRCLPFPDRSRDRLIVQGGLHHLPDLASDLRQTLSEARRVLVPGGELVLVEPWLTPFLSLVHRIVAVPVVRLASPKLDALATMIEHERHTYFQWLSHPETILHLLEEAFTPRVHRIRFGKIEWIGIARPATPDADRA